MSAVKRHENELTDVTSDFQNGSDLGIPLLPRSTSDSSLSLSLTGSGRIRVRLVSVVSPFP